MKAKFTITAIIFAAAAFYLSRVFWPDLPEMALPSAGEMPFFLALSVIEALAFGAGVSFLVFGWPRLKAAFPEYKALDRLAFLGIAWSLISWWPHDNMHRVTPEGDYVALLWIEYGYHVTLMIAGLLIARFFWKVTAEKMTGQV